MNYSLFDSQVAEKTLLFAIHIHDLWFISSLVAESTFLFVLIHVEERIYDKCRKTLFACKSIKKKAFNLHCN